MTQEKDICPVNDSGNHRYFIFRILEVFEPIPTITGVKQNEDISLQLYKKIEYAIFGCNCGSAIRQKVAQPQ